MTTDAGADAGRYDHLAHYWGPVTLPAPLLEYLPLRVGAPAAAEQAGEEVPRTGLPRPPRLVPLRPLVRPAVLAAAPPTPKPARTTTAAEEGLAAAAGIHLASEITAGIGEEGIVHG